MIRSSKPVFYSSSFLYEKQVRTVTNLILTSSVVQYANVATCSKAHDKAPSQYQWQSLETEGGDWAGDWKKTGRKTHWKVIYHGCMLKDVLAIPLFLITRE